MTGQSAPQRTESSHWPQATREGGLGGREGGPVDGSHELQSINQTSWQAPPSSELPLELVVSV